VAGLTDSEAVTNVGTGDETQAANKEKAAAQIYAAVDGNLDAAQFLTPDMGGKATTQQYRLQTLTYIYEFTFTVSSGHRPTPAGW
jgi:hypothetical protein